MKYDELTEIDHIDREAGLFQPEIVWKAPLPEWEYVGNGMRRHYTGRVEKMKAEILHMIPEVEWNSVIE